MRILSAVAGSLLGISLAAPALMAQDEQARVPGDARRASPAARETTLPLSVALDLDPAVVHANQATLPRSEFPPVEKAVSRPPFPARGGWTPWASLAAVLLLIVLTARLLRSRLIPSGKRLPAEVFEVLGRAPLGPKQSVTAVRWGPRLLLVVSDPQGVRTLSELHDAAEVDAVIKLCQPIASAVQRETQGRFRRPVASESRSAQGGLRV